MKMIKTSCGYMTPLEYKMINNIDYEKKKKGSKDNNSDKVK